MPLQYEDTAAPAFDAAAEGYTTGRLNRYIQVRQGGSIEVVIISTLLCDGVFHIARIAIEQSLANDTHLSTQPCEDLRL